MKLIKVRTKPAYEIEIRGGLLTDLATSLKEENFGDHYYLITDSNVHNLMAEDLVEMLKEKGIHVSLISFPAGEASKNMATVVNLAREMVRLGADRRSAIIAFGGGVTGDIAGFLASIYMRGIPYIQIPTTLLSQVDSSVGGKTGVDLPEGKNLLGTFYQPRRVYIDYAVLGLLPRKEFRQGLAEVVKYGLIKSQRLFSYLERRAQEIIQLEPGPLEHIIAESCRIKAWVVSRDEKEAGLRRILNLGHTLGHAFEAASSWRLPHGEAVAIGIVAAARISEKRGFISEEVTEKIQKLLISLGLPIRLPFELSKEAVISYLKSDKKAVSRWPVFVLLKGIGQTIFDPEVPSGLVEEIAEELGCR
ncbi:3-dehydroquinate synthase [Thermosulfuriphilus sp.]